MREGGRTNFKLEGDSVALVKYLAIVLHVGSILILRFTSCNSVGLVLHNRICLFWLFTHLLVGI